MKRIALLWTTALVATLASSGAYALSNRTFVSGNGSDANPCSLSAPCRSFAGALTQTSPGGEIAVLDTAGYGAVTITQAVSIVNEEGVEAGVTLAAAGSAITISAGASDVVNLRGLTLEGGGVGSNGIVLNSAGGLNVQSCVVRNFTNVGILLQPANPNPNGSFTIIDTSVENNTSIGIFVAPASGTIPNGSVLFVSLKRDTLIGNGDGFQLSAGINTSFQGALHATLVDVAAFANTGNAFAVRSQGTTAIGSATLYHSQASGPSGVLADTGFVTLSGSLLDTRNGGAYTITNNGTISTTGDNFMNSGTGTLNSLPLR
jgi:hypothetical protein